MTRRAPCVPASRAACAFAALRAAIAASTASRNARAAGVSRTWCPADGGQFTKKSDAPTLTLAQARLIAHATALIAGALLAEL